MMGNYHARCGAGEKPEMLTSEAYLQLLGIVPDFKKKLATARSRNLGMSILYQNIPQLQNRYPDGQWEEILGGCDTSLFLGCNDMTTATYFSSRSGEVTVGVSSVRKNLSTIRMSNYVPDYSETSSVGKRMLLLPDEILRFPLEQALVIIRGQKVLKVKKFDYSNHSDAKNLVLEKTEGYVPEWRERELDNGKWSEEDSVWDSREGRVCSREESAGIVQADTLKKSAESYEEERSTAESAGYSETIEKVEDLFTDEW